MVTPDGQHFGHLKRPAFGVIINQALHQLRRLCVLARSVMHKRERPETKALFRLGGRLSKRLLVPALSEEG